MESPIREQIRLDGWQARPAEGRSVNVFVPGAWAGKRVILKPTAAAPWSSAHIGETDLAREPGELAWSAGQAMQAGHWNTVTTDGNTAAGRLEAREPLHIASLEAQAANQRSLSVRIRLSGPEAAASSLLTIALTLSSSAGRLESGTEVTVSARTRDLSVELPSPRTRGLYRLKAAICCGERVIDNARIDLHV